MTIHKSAEDYLEAMLMLKEERGYIRSIDVAEKLGVTKPSVSYATKRLRENGYIAMDASGMIACPGLIDTHSHFRDPGFTHKEDLSTGAQAAIAGGYTSIILMANTNPPVDSVPVLEDILERGKKEKIHLYSCANVTVRMSGKETVDFDALAQAGAAGFTDDGVPIMQAEILEQALQAAVRLDLPVSLHEEDKTLISENGINGGGAAAQALGLKGSPREAEITLIRRDLNLAVKAMAPLCIQHISTREGVDLVREARKKKSPHPCGSHSSPLHPDRGCRDRKRDSGKSKPSPSHRRRQGSDHRRSKGRYARPDRDRPRAALGRRKGKELYQCPQWNDRPRDRIFPGTA